MRPQADGAHELLLLSGTLQDGGPIGQLNAGPFTGLADAGSTVREKAGTLKTSLADALESGAERLRQQGAGGGQIAGAAATGGTAGMIADIAKRYPALDGYRASGGYKLFQACLGGQKPVEEVIKTLEGDEKIGATIIRRAIEAGSLEKAEEALRSGNRRQEGARGTGNYEIPA